MSILDRLINWYFRRKALPYWGVLFIDVLICYLAGIFVFWLFFRAYETLAHFDQILRTLSLYIVVNFVGYRLFRTYSGIIRYSSFVDLQRVGAAMLLSFFLVWLLHYPILFFDTTDIFVHLQTRHLIGIYIISTIGMWVTRVFVKLIYDARFDNNNAKNTLVFGIHDGGIGIAKSIKNQKPQRFRLKGFVTDENSMGNRILMGQRVYLINDELKELLERRTIRCLIISPLQIEKFRKQTDLQNLLLDNGVQILLVEKPHAWSENENDTSGPRLTEVSIDDLLPRDEINVDLESTAQLLRGKKVLITGSAGSIGSEIVRQVATFEPEELILIDQAETPQHDIRLMMSNEFPTIRTQTIVASISNQGRMEKIFSKFRPDFVFHAAAYKHVPMMEDNTSESIQNNVLGTKIVADLSVTYGVQKFVMISTDKAVNPTNVMGCSKRICEIYVQSLNNAIREKQVAGSTQFVTTRFGNVLGSNGSVIPLFKKQIEAGGPVTVTDPNIIRYFMLIPEACKLVLEAGTKGKGGEIFVFDMGKPVKIAELAKRMILLSGARHVQIKYTGLRPGEKLYEELLTEDEGTLPSFHEKIRIAKVRTYDYFEVCEAINKLIEISYSFEPMDIVKQMKGIVPEYISKNSVFSSLDHA